MSRQITIVNTSNAEHEEWIIRSSDLPESHETVLKPGESVSFTPVSDKIFILPQPPLYKPKPFVVPCIDEFGDRQDKQVYPKVKVEFV